MKHNMSEAGCSIGHVYELSFAKRITISQSPRIPGKKFVEPRGFLGVGRKAQIFPRCEILHELV